jgi:hypothetical protein
MKTRTVKSAIEWELNKEKWGEIEIEKVIAGGIVYVSTPGHGGFVLSENRNKAIPKYMRMSDGCYEEDCDWSIVAVVFSEFLQDEKVKQAKETLKNCKHKMYETFFKIKLKKGESRSKDSEIFLSDNKNNYIGITALG